MDASSPENGGRSQRSPCIDKAATVLAPSVLTIVAKQISVSMTAVSRLGGGVRVHGKPSSHNRARMASGAVAVGASPSNVYACDGERLGSMPFRKVLWDSNVSGSLAGHYMLNSRDSSLCDTGLGVTRQSMAVPITGRKPSCVHRGGFP